MSGTASKSTRQRRAADPDAALLKALKGKPIRTAHYDIPLVSYDDAKALAVDVQKARNDVALARFGNDPETIATAERRFAEAEKAEQEAYRRLILRPVQEADQERLKADYPTDDETPLWQDAYAYHLLAASADSSLTGEQWAEILGDREHWTEPDVVELLSLVMDVCNRPFSAGIPKG